MDPQQPAIGTWAWNIADLKIYWSDEVYRLHDLGKEDLSGPMMKNLARLIDCIDPTDIMTGLDIINKAFESGDSYKVEYRVLHADESIRWVEARGEITFGPDGTPLHMEGIVRDITSDKQIAQSLRESEERLLLALEASHTGIWDWNIGNHGIYWSDDVYKIHGLTKQYVAEAEEGHACLLDRIHPDDLDRAMQVVDEAMQSGDNYDIEYRVVLPEGELRWVEAKGRLINDSDGSPLRITGTVQDITERKNYAELVEAKERAEEMNRLKDGLLSMMSHEIRTPLAGILGFADILLKDLDREDSLQHVAYIKKSGMRLLGMLTSMMNLVRLKTDSVDVCWQVVDVAEEAREAVRLLRPLAAEKGLSLAVTKSPPALCTMTDPAILYRVLNNLITNAIKFTERGYIVVRLASNETHIIIEVEDTGVGIAAAFMPDLFKEFTQESMGLSRSYEGSGLGLAITQRLIEKMEGSLAVASEKDKGSCFTVSIPLRSANGLATNDA